MVKGSIYYIDIAILNAQAPEFKAKTDERKR